jgi:lipoprotein-anchoring transpeptidase ErfK/SrfK
MKRHVIALAMGFAAAFGAATFDGVAPASAQFWGSVGGANTVSDRKYVSFPTQYAVGEIIVSFSDRRLYHVVSKGRAMSYPIAVPRSQSRWQGVLRVSQKRVNPPWTPTPSMRRENPKLPAFVEGGDPRNPLGVRALYLGSTLYRIHGTDAPSSIGRDVSKGCIRMHNAHVVELYERTNVGAKVTVTWTSFTGSAPQAGTPPRLSDAAASETPNSGIRPFNPFPFGTQTNF